MVLLDILSQAGNQLQIHDDFTAHLVLPSLIQIEQNLRWMSPHWKKTPKEVETTIYCSRKSGWYFNPHPKKLALQTQIESWPFYLGGDRSSLPSVPPNLFAAGANHLSLPVPRTFLSIRGYFWPQKTRLWVIARHFFFRLWVLRLWSTHF